MGDVRAQFIAGNLAATGKGGGVNVTEAFRWFLRAAEQGHATAAFNVAALYAEGTGVEQDIKSAMSWYAIASAGGLKEAAGRLASLYLDEGEHRNVELALKWLKTAADQGDLDVTTLLTRER